MMTPECRFLVQQPRQRDLRHGNAFTFGDGTHHVRSRRRDLYSPAGSQTPGDDYRPRSARRDRIFRSADHPPAGSIPSTRRLRSASSAPVRAQGRARRWCRYACNEAKRQPQTLRDAERFGNLPCRPVRDADIAYVTVLHKIIQRVKRLLDGGRGSRKPCSYDGRYDPAASDAGSPSR